jgi:hypothetical protein
MWLSTWDSMYGRVRQNHLFCCLKCLGAGRSRCGLERSERECWGAEWATNERWNSRSMGDGRHGLGTLVCGLQGYRGGDLRSRRWDWNRASAWAHRCPTRNLGFVRGGLASCGRSLGPSLSSSPRPEGSGRMEERSAGGAGDVGLVRRANAAVGGRDEREPSSSSLAVLASSQQWVL